MPPESAPATDDVLNDTEGSERETAGRTKLAGFRLSLTDLVRRTWAFGTEGGERTYAPHLKLLANGTLGGHLVEVEWGWALRDGRLFFFDSLGRPSTVFDEVLIDRDGHLVLVGPFVREPGAVRHELREIEPVGEIMPAKGLDIIRRGGPGRRKNLVVCGANERSLHAHWTRDIPEQDRSWDLLINFYGKTQNFGYDPLAEYQTREIGYGKWAGMHHLCQQGSPVWDYDYIAFPDDDLMMSWRDINEMFAICRQFGLKLAQPSLRPSEIPISHAITQQDPRYLLRFTSFVETMAPFFSRDALEACVGTFATSASGFGIDNVWPKLLGEPTDRIAVVDRVSILHTRPMASTYDLAAAVEEGNAVQRRYNAPSRVVEHGAIFAEAQPR